MSGDQIQSRVIHENLRQTNREFSIHIWLVIKEKENPVDIVYNISYAESSSNMHCFYIKKMNIIFRINVSHTKDIFSSSENYSM